MIPWRTITLPDPDVAADGEPHPPVVGSVDSPASIGRFVVTGMLGSGGMGTVLEGHDEALGRRVAIKVLHRGVTGGHDCRQRLRREARALARLSHPNVVQVFEVGEHEGRMYVAMERVVGCTFAEWRERAARRFEEIRDMLCAAGRGLEAAHDHGLLHRDFKPENVLVGDDGRPRVVDFGLVRRLPRASMAPLSFVSLEPAGAGGRRAGTVPYMAPEQLIGQPLDARVDQFAFCVVFYEAVYGRHPFDAPGAVEIGLRIIAGERIEPPPRSDVPAWLPGVLARGMALRPEDRFADMGALLRALQPVESARPAPSRLLVGGAVVAMAVGVASSVVAWSGVRPGVEPAECVESSSSARVVDDASPIVLPPAAVAAVLSTSTPAGRDDVDEGARRQRVREIFVEALGPSHPDLAVVLGYLCQLHAEAGHWQEAERDCRRALEILEPIAGPEHSHVAALRARLGELRRARDSAGLEASGAEVRVSADPGGSPEVSRPPAR